MNSDSEDAGHYPLKIGCLTWNSEELFCPAWFVKSQNRLGDGDISQKWDRDIELFKQMMC